MPENPTINTQHPKGLLVTLLRLLCRRSIGDDESNNYLDVHLVCQDGVVGWNRFLLAANSQLLKEALANFDEENYATLLLPDVSVATVSSMLKCTLNPAVKNDTLSVNELQVMKLLGFPISNPSVYSESEERDNEADVCDRPPGLDFSLPDCMQDGFVSEDLDVNIDPEIRNQTGNSILGNDNEDVEDNLDNISLLSSTLSIGDVSRVIIGLKASETVGLDKKDSTCETPTQCTIDTNELILPPPQLTTKQSQPSDELSSGVNLTEKELISQSVKSSIDKLFDRESVINTPTLPNLTADEQDELVSMPDFPLHSEDSALLKKPDELIEQEKILQSVGILSSADEPKTIANKNLMSETQLDLEDSSTTFEKGGWTISERSSNCDLISSQPEITKGCDNNEVSMEPSTKAKTFACPTPSCKLVFQRRLHYERHIGNCLAKYHHGAEEKTVVPEAPFKCGQCEKAFHHIDNLRLHEKYHADLLVEKTCNICGASGIMGRHALTAHIEKHHSTKMPCPSCNKILSSRRLLNRHISRMHQNESESSKGKRSVPKQNLKYCDVCKKGFATQISLLLHQKTHEDVNLSFEDEPASSRDVSMNDKETYVRCDECSKLFRNQQHLVSHKNRSHNAEAKECQECGRCCKNLQQHEKIFHNSEAILARAMDESKDGVEGCPSATDDLLHRCNSKKYECEYCFKVFTTKYIHDNHVKREHATKFSTGDSNTPIMEEGHKCETCGKRYLNKSGLKRHLKEAHGENRYECKECGQFFPVKHSLERHVAHVHHRTRHTCPICKDVSVVHLKAHLTGPSHQMSSFQAQSLVDEVVGKFAARTHLPLDDIIRRRESKDMID